MKWCQWCVTLGTAVAIVGGLTRAPPCVAVKRPVGCRQDSPFRRLPSLVIVPVTTLFIAGNIIDTSVGRCCGGRRALPRSPLLAELPKILWGSTDHWSRPTKGTQQRTRFFATRRAFFEPHALLLRRLGKRCPCSIFVGPGRADHFGYARRTSGYTALTDTSSGILVVGGEGSAWGGED